MAGQLDKAKEIIRALIDPNNVNPADGDDVSAMLRFGKACDEARAFLVLGCAPPEVGALAPQESPLAWAVFVHLDPQGFDYRIFPDEQEAADVAGENPENGEPVPLYRTSAFSPLDAQFKETK